MCWNGNKDQQQSRISKQKLKKPQTSMRPNHNEQQIQWGYFQTQWLVSFIEKFWHELQENHNILISEINILQKSDQVEGYKQLTAHPFTSITDLNDNLRGRKNIENEMLVQRLTEPYALSYGYIRKQKRIKISVLYFLEVIKKTIIKGFLQEDEQFHVRKACFKQEDYKLRHIIEQIIELAKQSSKKERQQKLVEQLNNSPQLEQNQQQNQQLKKLVKQYYQRIKELEQINLKLTNENNTYSAVTIPNLKSKLLMYESATSLEHKNMESNTKAQEWKYQTEQKQKLIEEYLDKISVLQKKIAGLEKIQQTSCSQRQTIETLQNQVSRLKQQNISLSEIRPSQIATSPQSEFLVSQMQQLLTSLKEELAKKEQQLTNTLKQLKQTQHQCEQYRLKIESQQKVLARTKRQCLEKQQQIQKLKDLNMELAGKIQDLRSDPSRYRTKSFVQHKTLLSGDILQPRKPQKRFMLQHIQSLECTPITKTTKLYDYPRDKQINFHKIIDGHSNMAIIVETVHGYLVAAYYSGVYKPKTSMTEQGLMMSLTNYKCYKLQQSSPVPKKDRKERPIYGMVYDQFFIIFGNSEVRIKNGENKLFSNFGVNNAYFNSQGDKVNILLGQGKINEVEIVRYEIHEIDFEPL